MTFFDIFPIVVSFLLFYLLLLVVKAIPLQLAWDRSNFENLIWMCITTIVFSVFICGYLFFNSGLVKNGDLIIVHLFDALYFSVTTWTTLGYGDLTAPDDLHLLTSLEAINGYFAMAIFISLIVIWINEAIAALDKRTAWIRSLTPEQVQEMQNKIDPSIRVMKDNEKSSNKANLADAKSRAAD